MPESPASASMPRTLGEAKTVIANLRKQLSAKNGSLPGGSKPIPKTPETPYPNPDPSVGPPSTQRATIDLASMSPKRFAETLELCDDKALLAFLSRETGKSAKGQDASVIRRLYE